MGYLMGWALFAASLFGSAPKIIIEEALPDLLVLFPITTGLARLVTRSIAFSAHNGFSYFNHLGLMLIAGVMWTQSYPDQALF